MTARIEIIDGKKACSSTACTNPRKNENGLLELCEFAKARDKTSGLSSWCKACLNRVSLKKRAEHPELGKLRYQKSKIKSRGRIIVPVSFKACGKPSCGNPNKLENGVLAASEFYADINRKSGLTPYCKYCMQEYRKVYVKNNAAKEKLRHKKYTDLHKLERKEYGARYAKMFPEIRKQTKKNWCLKNPDYYNRYIKNRRNTDFNFRLRQNISRRIGMAFRAAGRTKSKRSVDLLGCSVSFFRDYLRSKYLPGMTDNNYGKGSVKWNIDHIIPLASFNLTDVEQASKAFHYTNCQPLWEPANQSKLSKLSWSYEIWQKSTKQP
jgi:hypothetical protein